MSAPLRQAFEETCLPILPDCYAFALSLTRTAPDADDLVQETFMKAQRAFASFATGTNAKAWLFTILRRLHIDAFRRKRVRPTSLPEEELVEMARLPNSGPNHEADLTWDHLAPGAVRAAIEEIPEPFQQPVRLRDLDGFAYREIGEILDIPAGTVMSRLHRGREYLRRSLVSQMESPSERPGGAGRGADRSKKKNAP